MMRGMGSMGNMQGVLQKAQKMQKELAKEQARIEETVFEKSDSNQLVTVKMTGKRQITELTIAPDLLDPDDVEMLQDLVLSTVNGLIVEIDTITEERLGKYTKGLNLPF
ncbi:YbaB/EbfC family nucleoid-associated protein [Aerococcaceae bacterium zg-ZUI334]|uniref:YbaB/EbfC family nucleoid-associated protein n=1 Tax=Aerococcaceae bacterium zg-252 TaxID=2796928 RepID=UPI001B9B83F4|nr:YbaB/EbfC family nucleoid-associated protein [Aerococcaceae bacterium zg-ZUI334]